MGQREAGAGQGWWQETADLLFAGWASVEN